MGKMESIESLQKHIESLNQQINSLKADRKSSRIANEHKAKYEESQIRFRTVFETSRLGNKIITPDLKILQVNSALVTLLGYDHKDEIIGTKILEYVPSEFHTHWILLQKKLWQLNTPSFSLETCLRKKDGTIIWCHVNSILFQDGGGTLGYTIIEDVTEQHELKKHRENFISIASHELKTPLTTLVATVQLIDRHLVKDATVTDNLIKLFESSKRSVSKLASLVADLMDSTRMSNGQLTLNVCTFNISELFEKCCHHLNSDGKYNIIYRGDPSLQMKADEQKIDQVLVNFINNAVKYAPNSKEIIVQAEEFDDQIKLSVIDYGHGIPKEKLDFLFNSYYQVSGNDSTQGLGLGLYISAQIIKKHNGEIGVDSEQGKGSTFWFTIPKGQII